MITPVTSVYYDKIVGQRYDVDQQIPIVDIDRNVVGMLKNEHVWSPPSRTLVERSIVHYEHKNKCNQVEYLNSTQEFFFKVLA